MNTKREHSLSSSNAGAGEIMNGKEAENSLLTLFWCNTGPQPPTPSINSKRRFFFFFYIQVTPQKVSVQKRKFVIPLVSLQSDVFLF